MLSGMSETTFVSVRRMAGLLGLPAAWLEREARAGRVPALRAGRRLLFDPEQVRAELANQAARNSERQARQGTARG
jgi:hypothetical protein